MKAIVVFCDTTHRLAWFLKPGFRHCFVCVVSNGLWIQIDARYGVPYVKYLTTADFDLGGYFRDLGCTVIETEQRQHAGRFPLVVRSCTGLVAAMLCLKSWALTPYQLYKYLRRQ